MNHAPAEATRLMAAELQGMASKLATEFAAKQKPTPRRPLFTAPAFDSVARDAGRPSYGMSCHKCGDERESHFSTLCKRCAGGAA